MTQHTEQTSVSRRDRESAAGRTGQSVEIVDARTLFGSAREIGIKHDGVLYRLRITRQGKLLLNK